ncbi:MAG TPA: PilZ domain-containing protein [Hyphomicrobiaceae bacterium]|nr:PilZ domain-containing protein [Hyphomicrobiaceae bacterium]
MASEAITSPIERRSFGRRQTLWHAWIAAPGRARFACLVRNISPGGALLECEVPPWLPHEFRLIVEAHDIDIECDLRHRGKFGIGVQFRAVLNHPAVTAQNRPNTVGIRKSAEREHGRSPV